MNNKKLGIILVAFSIVLGLIAFQVISKYSASSSQMNCMSAPGCANVGSVLNYTHLAVGVLFSLLSLGVYMLVFNSGSTEAILKRLEEEKNTKISEERFGLLLKTMDPNEQKVLGSIKDDEGISQNMVRIKTGLSKAKVSLILSNFERKNLIKREPNGKTYSVYLVI